ncbi:hypothetical protein T4C_6899, partial [Trichinella pseudospiralis]
LPITKAYCDWNMKNNTDQMQIFYYQNYAVRRRNGNAFCCLLRMPNGIAKEEERQENEKKIKKYNSSTLENT